MRVKICGLREERHVEAAIEAGASAIGLVLAPSPRQVSIARARALAAHAGDRVERVAVLRTFSPDAFALAAAAGCTHLQVSGARQGGSLPLVPAVHDGVDAEGELALVRTLAPIVLFDAPRPGSGTLPSLERAARLARLHPLVLAGGLDADNVADAIAHVRPYGVDVSSGVERAPGEKSVERIHAFVRAALRALDLLSAPRPEVSSCP
ncbi:MAG: phosphoribosylanthranilate isomerase [Sandaracinus sp.]